MLPTLPANPTVQRVEAAINGASSIAIQRAIRKLKKEQLAKKRWLGKLNHYLHDTTNVVDDDAFPSRWQNKYRHQIAEYIGASSILHAANGWTFLSQSTKSLLDGDLSTSIHLAYYAELRAAMSLLASEGIGIFNSQHVWIDANGGCNFIGPLPTRNASGRIVKNGIPTHKMVWQAIHAWGNDVRNATRLLELFRIQGRNLRQWLDSVGYSTTPLQNSLAKDWLDMWSLDLQTLGDDHNSRNEVSYRPQPIRPVTGFNNLEENLKSILDFWLVCEPADSERFQLLDSYLLRESLRFCYQNFPYPTAHTFEEFVDQTISNVVSGSSTFLRTFILRGDTPLLFDQAKQEVCPERPQPLPIIARAILLLRVASAAVERNLMATRVSREDLKFWWEGLGNDYGYWANGSSFTQMTDLWADIRDSITLLDDWCNTSPDKSKLDLNRTHSYELMQISQFNRAGLWAIGI